MLSSLCGNKNIQKILLFLFINEKCYGTQLQRLLKTPLTPLQKALLKLEKGGLLTSFYEGKTRLYQFHPGYPLLPELRQLLEKCYTLLPPHEKKLYFLTKKEHPLHKDNPLELSLTLLSFWEKLTTVKELRFRAKTKSQGAFGWNGNGKGEVLVTKEKDTVLIFHEKGMWQGKQGEVSFSNVYRWTLDQPRGIISLEHLRRGVEHPVFIFHLAPSNTQTLSSVDPHLCEADSYFGQIFFDKFGLRLNWRVIGPKKNEEMDAYYF